MAKEKEITVVDDEVQTTQEFDNSSNKLGEPSIYQKININKYNHKKAQGYLEQIEEKIESSDNKWLESAYSKIEQYMQTLCDSRSFTEGFNLVIGDYEASNNDKESFILIHLLEEFSDRFSPNRYYTEAMHNKDFQYALSLAPEIEQSVLGAISNLEDIE